MRTGVKIATLLTGGGVPNPITILGASALAWWTADRADLITLSGSQVTSWKDVVHAYNAVQGVSGSRPLWSATSFNGSPGITYDGVDDEVTLAIQPFPTTGDIEIWAIQQQDALSGDATARAFFSYGGGAANTAVRAYRISTNKGQVQVGSGAANLTATNGNTNFTGRTVARALIGLTASEIDVETLLGTPVSIVPAFGSSRARLGANDGAGAGAFWQGIIRDIVVTTTLTAPQAAAMQTWANARRML